MSIPLVIAPSHDVLDSISIFLGANLLNATKKIEHKVLNRVLTWVIPNIDTHTHIYT